MNSSSTRLARRTITASWSLIPRSTAVVGRGGPITRSASSSSSSSSSSLPQSNKSQKAEKKLVDRLSTVIDAVNDRKLPPELRGQRNAVRSSLSNYQIISDIYYLIRNEMLRNLDEWERHNFSTSVKKFHDVHVPRLLNCGNEFDLQLMWQWMWSVSNVWIIIIIFFYN